MLIRRTIELSLVALLIAALGAIMALGSATSAREQGFVVMAQAALTATPSSDCGQCEECAEPCTVSITCSAACISGLVPAASGPGLTGLRRQLRVAPGWQVSSADLRTPTPPPRLSV